MPTHAPLALQNEVEGAQLITREYGLYCRGRFVSQAMGEHTFYSRSNLAYGKACESAKSNALMRCCKDLGVASELWDPRVSAWVTRPCVALRVCPLLSIDCSIVSSSSSGRPSMLKSCGVRT